MPFLGSIIPASLVRLGAQRRRVERDRREARRAVKAAAAQRGADVAELRTPAVADAEPPRPVAENGSEDAHADHEQHGLYHASHEDRPASSRLDVEG